MGVLASKAHRVPFDPEGSEHRSQRDVELLQYGSLLDVQLQVGCGVL